ncbi:MAG TPA: hydrogenase maturation protease [Kiritimatiellia bacterium]|nr:hydrogenase maturation protease [Kiritimatiellia bacterium]
MKKKTVILGAGNLLMSDDGAGVHALWLLRADPLPGMKLVDVGTAVLDAVPHIDGAGMVVILDAVEGGGAPGDVYVLHPEDIRQGGNAASVHSLGLLDSYRMLCPGKALPPAVIVGVEPAMLGYGTTLSPAVEAALPRMAEAVRSIVERALHPAQGVPS